MAGAAVAFAVVFLAELGDKSQLVVLALVGRLGVRSVAAALVVAMATLQGLSALAGSAIGSQLSSDAAGVVAAVAFVVVGVWTLVAARRGGDEPADFDLAFQPRSMLLAALALFAAELGDKTMFATVAISAEHGFLAPWIGGTAGVLAANGAVVAIGSRVGPRLAGWWNTIIGTILVVVGLGMLVVAL